MEGDAPAHQANRAALRAGRPDLPAAAAAGRAPMGVRQPQNLTAPRRAPGGRPPPLVVGVGGPNRDSGSRKPPGPTPAAERASRSAASSVNRGKWCLGYPHQEYSTLSTS